MDDPGDNEWVERVKEYFIVCVHAILYARSIYPSNIFEQRRYLGIIVWRSRHSEVNAYIEKVIENAHPMIELNLVDRVVVSLETKDGKPVDSIVIKCTRVPSQSLNDAERGIIEEEFRSTILRIGMLDQQMTKSSTDFNWKIMIITSLPDDPAQKHLMQDSLTNGEWYVDNNKLPEQTSLAHRAQLRETPRLLPIKSYRDSTMNLTAYAHIYRVKEASSEGIIDEA